ncbi:MAG: ribbon-helix-helix protein, CopG family [Candidatus Schekmanbacteria bacterium]|nr:ribbon-helix-helix protein, CopG family [Candidatus Schekmanbacteria bacterium]
MARAVKIAISLTEEEFKEVEKLRKERGINRSKLIAEAVSLLNKKSRTDELLRKYEEGYKKKPEDLQELKGFQKASMDVLNEEDW